MEPSLLSLATRLSAFCATVEARAERLSVCCEDYEKVVKTVESGIKNQTISGSAAVERPGGGAAALPEETSRVLDSVDKILAQASRVIRRKPGRKGDGKKEAMPAPTLKSRSVGSKHRQPMRNRPRPSSSSATKKKPEKSKLRPRTTTRERIVSSNMSSSGKKTQARETTGGNGSSGADGLREEYMHLHRTCLSTIKTLSAAAASHPCTPGSSSTGLGIHAALDTRSHVADSERGIGPEEVKSYEDRCLDIMLGGQARADSRRVGRHAYTGSSGLSSAWTEGVDLKSKDVQSILGDFELLRSCLAENEIESAVNMLLLRSLTQSLDAAKSREELLIWYRLAFSLLAISSERRHFVSLTT